MLPGSRKDGKMSPDSRGSGKILPDYWEHEAVVDFCGAPQATTSKSTGNFFRCKNLP